MKKAGLLILVLFCVFRITAQKTRTYHSLRTLLVPKIDGDAEDESWKSVPWEGDFMQLEPVEGAAPSQKTMFKLIYDDDNIYVLIKSFDSEPDLINRRLSRRDEWEGDMAGVHFDSYHDKRTGFVFVLSAAGVKNDGIMNDENDSFDDSYDPVWYAKSKIISDGWIAEFRIPLSQLRFGNSYEQTWGFNVVRSIYRIDEFSMWSPASKKNHGFVNQYGLLTGMKQIKPRKQVEISPFVVSKYENYEKEEGNPFADGSDTGLDAGVDGKIGITNNIILDFAINPDFGQVEADPSEINLTEFETYFVEKRPFFVEGKNITNFQLTMGDSPWSTDNLFYSRRIGRRPQLDVDLLDGEYAKLPQNTRILGAFKVSGKTKNGISLGIIESVTNSTKALIDNNGSRRKQIVEPMTNYFISRLQKDFSKGNTIMGAMFTSTYRFLDDKNDKILPVSALTGGVDFTQYFKNKKFFLNLQFAGSHIKGSKESISELQLSSRRYFQRPDPEYFRYDPEKTNLSGTGGTFVVGKLVNEGFRFAANFTWRSPGLETNDVGFLREANSIFEFLWLGYVINKPFAMFRSVQFNANQWSGLDFNGNILFKGGNINTNLTFKNLWRFGCGINYEGNNIANTFLRGGPAMYVPGNWNYWFNISSNPKKKLSFSGGSSINDGFKEHLLGINYFGSMTYKPVNSFNISLMPSFNSFRTELQYVDSYIFQNQYKYIFGGLDQSTFNLTVRVNYNITPDLSVQYYGSPFAGSVVYDEFKSITDPKAKEYTNRFMLFDNNSIHYNSTGRYYSIDESGDGLSDHHFDNPDFNFRQFRSNMVVRWEFVPGSTVFLAWSQSRTDFEEISQKFNLKNSLRTLFNVTPYDIFLLKISYRLRAETLF
ncbi:MAG: DUF5916 domain-containing protein [Deltaproteobacteria bacterium]